mmetsp:Transcript_6296/g.20235  ORF Transcript_6296/g.20235 Transcript_6296/m.20235 type:complete len:919 (-) Transcript_6296:1670-4426(-)
MRDVRFGPELELCVIGRQDLNEVGGQRHLLGRGRRFDVVEVVRAPVLEHGVVPGVVLVVRQTDILDALPTKLREGLVHLLGSLVEEDVRGIAHAEYRKLRVLHEVRRRRLQERLHLLPELHGRLGHVALARGRNDGQHLRLVCEVADGKVVEGQALCLHSAPLHLKLEVLGHNLGVTRVCAVQDGHALADDLLAHALFEVLQQVLVVHSPAAAHLVPGPGAVDHGALQELGVLRSGAPQGGEAVLVRQEVLHHLVRDALVVKLETVGVSLANLVGVVPVHRPIAALHCLHLLEDHGLVTVAVAPVHTRGVRNDNRGASVRLCLPECLDGLVHIRRKRDGGDVGVLMHHGNCTEVLLLGGIAARCHLHNSTLGCRLGNLRSSVAVALSVEHQNVDVLAGRQHVVQTPEANVVCPAIAADDPVRRGNEHILRRAHGLQQRRRIGAVFCFQETLDGGLHGAALVGVLVGVKPLLQQSFKIRGDQPWRVCRIFEELLRGELQLLAALHRAQRHAQAILGRVLEEGPRPSRSLSVPVLLEGAQAVRPTPDRGAAAAVCDDHAVSEHLRQELHIGRLAAAGAGTAEFHQRLLELRPLHGHLVHQRILDRHGVERVLPVLVECLLRELGGLHLQGVVGTHLYAHGAAGAVVRRHLDGEVQAAQLSALALAGQVALGACLHLLLVQEEGPDDGVRADDAAQVALGAEVRNPDGDLLRQRTLLVDRLPNGRLAAGMEGTDGQAVGLAGVDALEEGAAELVDVLAVLRCGRVHHPQRPLSVLCGEPGLGILHSVQVLDGCCQCSLVRTHDVGRLLAVHPVNGRLELLAGVLGGQDAGEVEEGCLHHLVDALGRETHGGRNGMRIDGVEVELLLRDLTAELGREVLVEILNSGPGAVHDEGGARPGLVDHVELGQERRVVARHVVSAGA